MDKKDKNISNEQLILIPKEQEYIQYMLEVILKLPRIEKFNIGNEYKTSMYQMLENTLYISKVSQDRLDYLNKIDARLNCQRIYLRIMYKNKWIDEKKFQVAISKIAEIGRILGGLIKYYAQNTKK
ncbi:MAG: four helix bundle protein [Clostridia bacterium]|nr:four helix bundle protein [Clostridia bacterium]